MVGSRVFGHASAWAEPQDMFTSFVSAPPRLSSIRELNKALAEAQPADPVRGRGCEEFLNSPALPRICYNYPGETSTEVRRQVERDDDFDDVDLGFDLRAERSQRRRAVLRYFGVGLAVGGCCVVSNTAGRAISSIQKPTRDSATLGTTESSSVTGVSTESSSAVSAQERG